MVQERGLRVGVVHLTGCGVGLGFSQKEWGGGGGRRDGPGERVEGESGSPYRVWGRDGVLTERRGRG